MKKPNFGRIFLRFEFYQKNSKITNFQNSLEKPYFVPWSCKTLHSKGVIPSLNCKMVKKAFHRFQPIKSAHDWVKYGGFGTLFGSYAQSIPWILQNTKKIVLRQNSSKKLHFVLRSSINCHLKRLFFILSFGNGKKVVSPF